MCGIGGIINKNNEIGHELLIRNLTDVIKHRGPDGEGFYYGSNFALSHRRLSIIDLSNNASQPMDYLGRYKIVFNGEIYNYLELKSQLLKLGYLFNTSSDTEIIMAAYDYWGIKCLDFFNGMWSFVIYDNTKNILFCARDRFGVKPFYYYDSDKYFVFGSEIKQLKILLDKVKVNYSVLMDYLVGGFEDHNNFCFFENIKKLEQGHYLIYNLSNHTYQINKYYELKINEDFSKIPFNEALNIFDQLFKSAIQLRLRSDVNVGTCLSGGIDSSSIASIAAKEYTNATNKPFSAITAQSIENKYDESKWAQKVVERENMDWHTVKPDSNDFFSLINELIQTQEEPFGSASLFLQYTIFQKARKINCPVMLDGQGGDEIFLGYERYYPSYLNNLPFFEKIKTIYQIQKNSKLSLKQIILFNIYFRNYLIRLKKLKYQHNYIKNSFFDYFNIDLLKKSSLSYNNIFEMQKYEINNLQLPHLLKYEDRNSMRHSIESRLPFLDYRIVEFALSIPIEYKINNGWTKYIIRKYIETFADPEVVWRKNKIGFKAPENIWFSQFDEHIRKTIFNAPIINKICHIDILKKYYPSLNNVVKWRLFNIAKWEEINEVNL